MGWGGGVGWLGDGIGYGGVGYVGWLAGLGVGRKTIPYSHCTSQGEIGQRLQVHVLEHALWEIIDDCSVRPV